ncbi:uncharacterized protein J4E78_010918 [Alternaria triticimaculans]|uniref:uncharacterized protein n=1 Tax=Alternaria triticimaculans TaxID=297637 RepID=UPI0020C27E82|nr:uncharacterized protein J4E78_010918 [Alternaria triticimaculans]KAI4639507.1 hypothetical protein J4E78_010918 [Alternaria triticimaculans]
MSSHPYIDEFLFDRDVLTPSLHTTDQFETESHSDMRPEVFDEYWLTASSEPCDETVDHGAISGHIATTTSLLNDCLMNLENDENSASSHFRSHQTVAWGEDTLEDSAVWLGDAIADANNGPRPISKPFGGLESKRDAPDGYALIPNVQYGQEMEENWNVEPAMPEYPDLIRKATYSGSRHTTVGRDVSHPEFRKSITPTIHVGDIPFRVEIKRVYICTHTGCDKKYSRMPDLRRHYRGSHLDDRRFLCRALGCERAIHGFPRRDKRDVHEKKMHIDIGNGVLL